MMVGNNLLICSSDKPLLIEEATKYMSNKSVDVYNKLILDLGDLLTSASKFVAPTDLNTCLFSPSDYDTARPHAIKQIVDEVCQCISASSKASLVIINNVELLPKELINKLMNCASTHRCSVRFIAIQLYSPNMCWQYRSSTHVTETVKSVIDVSKIQRLSKVY